jgi:translation initiation factor IF-3
VPLQVIPPGLQIFGRNPQRKMRRSSGSMGRERITTPARLSTEDQEHVSIPHLEENMAARLPGRKGQTQALSVKSLGVLQIIGVNTGFYDTHDCWHESASESLGQTRARNHAQSPRGDRSAMPQKPGRVTERSGFATHTRRRRRDPATLIVRNLTPATQGRPASPTPESRTKRTSDRILPGTPSRLDSKLSISGSSSPQSCLTGDGDQSRYLGWPATSGRPIVGSAGFETGANVTAMCGRFAASRVLFFVPEEDVIGPIDRGLRVNEQIRISPVRVINPEGVMLGVMPTSKALEAAREAGMDLVEVAPNERPPVCKIIDYGKFKYTQKKKLSKQKQHQVQVKEIRVRPKTGDHDIEVKVKRAREFLEHKDKVLVNVLFRGRELAHIDEGRRVMQEVLQALEEVGKVEKTPSMEGRRMTAILAPRT